MFKKEEDTFSYKGWLVSDFIMKRSFAVMGHYFLASFVVWIGIMMIVLVFAALGMGIGLILQ